MIVDHTMFQQVRQIPAVVQVITRWSVLAIHFSDGNGWYLPNSAPSCDVDAPLAQWIHGPIAHNDNFLGA